MNLDQSEKSKGVIILAKSTKTCDYVEIANRSKKFVEQNLKLPVTIICPEEDRSTTNKTKSIPTEWKNFFRWISYQQSPYDTTIVLDADYIALTNSLSKFIDGNYDYRLLKHSLTPSGPMESFMGERAKRHLWATVIVFKKTNKTQLLFEIVQRVEENWKYYSRLFKLDPYSFRNDFAFTIADLILNGYQIGQHNLPHSILTIVDSIKSLRKFKSFIHLRTENKNLVLPHQDLHLMDKNFLLSDEFLKFEESFNE